MYCRVIGQAKGPPSKGLRTWDIESSTARRSWTLSTGREQIMVVSRTNRRAIYRAIVSMPGWIDDTAAAQAAHRLASAVHGTVDQSAQIRVACRGRRVIVLEEV